MTDEIDTVEIMAEEEPTSTFSSMTDLFELYGWYAVILGIVLAIVYSQFKLQIADYNRRREEHAYAAQYHKDPDKVAARLAAQEAYARKLQEKYNQDAQEFQKKMEEKEANKRAEWLSKHGESGEKLGNSSKIRTEYNPLMGDTSRGYRAVKKSPCGGGGCGK